MRPFEQSHDETLAPEVEHHLRAIDRALAGELVDPELAELAELAAELRDLRAEPAPTWQRELDARLKAGFGRSRLESLRRRLPSRPASRMLAPAGALATALIVIAIGVSQLGSSELEQADTPTEALEAPTAGGAETEVPGGETGSATGPGSGPSAAEDDAAARGLDLAPLPDPTAPGTAPGKSKRQQDRSAFLALKAETAEVREISDRAIQITESAGGVVISSELSERELEATARLQLSIPTRELDATLDQLTDLATVESLNEAAVDITRPFVSAEDRLEDARAERRGLLRALGNASGDAEAEALRRQLRDARREISRAESAFDNIARRARSSEVSLQITGTPGGGSDGSWDLGEAADDALTVLETFAGILLITAAIIAPVAILIAITWAIAIAIRNRRRTRALDES